MQISKVNMITTGSFNGKSKSVDYLVDKAFSLLSDARKRQLSIYLGTTKNGENIYIKENKLGKNADLYISYNTEQAPKFDIFHLFRETGSNAAVTKDEAGRISDAEAQKIGQVLDNLYI